MKLVKSLLLGSVAGLATVAGVQAADLPSRKAAPVEYVRVCSAEGAGFFFIPGTDTCLRIRGRVRADYLWQEAFDRNQDVTGFRARARAILDARTPTAYGKLRTFISLDFTANGGALNSTGLLAGGGNGTTTAVDKAFIQWAGITAGRAQSFYDFFDLYTPAMGTTRNSARGSINLLAYTASFGGGFSATLSLEDPTTRRAGIAGDSYGGSRMPEIVGSLNVDQAWGSAALSGVFRQLYPSSPVLDTEYGWGVKAGLKLNLPMIAAGDEFVVEVGYADGGVDYTGGNLGSVGRAPALNPGDAVANVLTGDIDKTQSFNVAASFLHYWTPQIRQAVFGTFAYYDYDSAALVSEANEWRVGTNMFWRPVSGFDIGVEVLYVYFDPDGATGLYTGAEGTGEEDAFEVRLRFQRDF